MKPVIIFDFDGTLADTLEVILQITNCLAQEFGYKTATKQELAQIRQLNSWQIIKHSGISLFKIPFLMRRVRSELKAKIPEVELIPGIKEVLIELKHQGNSLGIITSNSQENVLEFIEKHGLQHTFDFIYSGTTLFGKHKIINKFLNHEQISPKTVIYVGDETRDIDAAKKAKVKVIAVSWGFNSPDVLAQHHPDFLIQHPRELLQAIKPAIIQDS